MDLAKIRQKARQGHQEQLDQQEQEAVSPVLSQAVSQLPEVVHERQPEPQVSHSVSQLDDHFFQESRQPVFSPHDERFFPAPHHRKKQVVDPLDAILAGRELAGCDMDLPLASDDHYSEDAVNDYEEYLCFRVSDETYGINIMDIKEIIKPREVTEVPRSPSFVPGVISLRGVIIPIIDMLDRLGLNHEPLTGKERVVVVKNRDSFTGLLVDEVIQVVRIAKDCCEAAPAVLEGIDRDFVSGIGRADNRMIILLNLYNIADINLF